jgi:hypothetical protein
MTNYNTQIVANWVFNLERLYYVYEIKHRRLCGDTIVPLNQWLLLDPKKI